MFAGHVGAGLALARAERRANLALFVSGAVLLDVLLWIAILAGVESVSIPADFAVTRQPVFEFPWTHGLAASLVWAALAALAAVVLLHRRREVASRAALLIAAAVVSHWILDALVHRPELPLGGAGSKRVGFALWDRLPLALAVEAVVALGGLALYWRGSTLARGRKIALATLVVLLLILTVAGMSAAPAPPSPNAMAASSLATLVAVVGTAAWIGRAPRSTGG